MHQVLVVLVDIFLVLKHGELQKLTGLLELKVGLLVVETVVNTATPLMVFVELTTKVVAVVKDLTLVVIAKLLVLVLLILVAVVEEDQVTIMVEETKVELKQEQEVLVLFL
jgi:hypothetical protein